MGVSPQQLSNQIEMDKQHDKQKAIDMQSTVSSHPAFDAKNLKHFVDMVDPYTTNDGMHTEREYKEDDSEESMSSGTSNSDSDEYSYSTSNAEEYVPNDAMSLASADPYPLHSYVHVAPHNVGLMDSIKEDKILVTPKGNNNNNNNNNDDTPNEYIIKSRHNNNNKNQAEKPNIFNNAILKQEEFFKCLQDEIYSIDTNNFHTSEIYGLVISFMGRHDRWLNCRLVCKEWNELVYDRYWIYTEHMTMDEANRLKPGDKVDHRDDAGRWIKSTILGRKDTNLNVHYDGWSSKWDSWCDYSIYLHKFAAVRSISRCPRVRGKHIEEKMFVDVKPSYRHGKRCPWRKGKVRRLDEYSGQIEVIYKYKNKKYLLWVHLDNKSEVDRLCKHSLSNKDSNPHLNYNLSNVSSNNSMINRGNSNTSLATTVHE